MIWIISINSYSCASCRHNMERKFIYLINPISGTARKDALEQMIIQQTKRQQIPFEILPTDPTGDYSGLAQHIQRESITDIIVCGGDGTINRVASHVHDTGVKIGIIPMGSGNGLALAAGIPTAPSRALDIIFRGRFTPVDGFYINGKFSCMLCGVGFDAQVAHDFAMQKRRGLQTYIKVSAINYFKAVTYPFSIQAANFNMDTEAYLVCVANSNQFGNNFIIAPKASLNDGLLDIVIVKKMSKLLMPFSIISQVTGINALQHLSGEIRENNILYFQTSELSIGNPSLAPLHIDGDPVATSASFHIKVKRDALNLLHP